MQMPGGENKVKRSPTTQFHLSKPHTNQLCNFVRILLHLITDRCIEKTIKCVKVHVLGEKAVGFGKTNEREMINF